MTTTTTTTHPAAVVELAPRARWPQDAAVRQSLARQIVEAAADLLETRPGFEPGNYGTLKDLRHDQRRATQALHHGRALLQEVRLGPDLDELLTTLPGRLTFTGTLDEAGQVASIAAAHYTAGQYYCVEYRPCIAGWLAEIVTRRMAAARGWLPFSLPTRRAMAQRYGRAIVSRYF